ncbi:anaphase-promoting complex subunit 1 isoform X3 [Hyposmocoma kahamanoa]|uniref:anaphase-promoting complex subunit 1 isoform X3 n=1 Tax=Hyposmocoma kahamanoa TaxID=1477025 RepID=UPI000E6D9109|nr:anaphase-promoting complex subunit 1 isoform X3 [Hyposmocoma kahamanoa]
MIAASEPLEFVPHGRTVIAKHPSQIYGKGHNCSASENSLLYKLTNFGIKDESLLETKDSEDQEWWSIREVYYKDSDDFDDDPQQIKDQKCDYVSDSFRPPSRLKNEFNMSIKSELLGGVKKMETDCNSGGPSRGGSANSSSNLSKKFNLNSGQCKSPNKKPLNPKTDCSYEEELYVKGCTAVWSKGLISTPASKLSGPEHRETISCYTIENPIKHATFANFHVSINNTMLIDALNSQIGDVKKNIKVEDTTEHIQSKVMPSILLLDSKCMRVYATDGREYVTSVPFQVKKVWPMKYGVLLEKDATPLLHNSFLPTSFIKFNESHNSTFSKSKSNHPFNMSAKLRAESVSGYDQDVPLPTCFSLSHPLDEVTPVLMKSPTQGLQYYNDGDLQIIFVSTNPSIILLYDWKLSIHSLWKIRKATRDECLSICPNMNSTTTVFSQSCDFIGSPMHSNTGKNTTNWMTGISSPLNTRRGPGTPATSRSRLNSPMANIFHQQGMSPHASIGQASSMSMMANTMTQTPPSLPLYPDVCLDHIWTDNQTVRRDPLDNPNDTKTFLHTDLVGHDYLCFMLRSGGVSKLHIVRLQKSHAHGQMSKTNLIVGTVSIVLAKDAVVLNHLKMIALIDEAGNIILQSGNHAVGKLHIGGVLARLIDSPYTKRGTFQSPFPRRSSLLPSRHDATFDDSALHLLSPVPHTSRQEHKETLGLRGLRDAAGSRVTLQFEGGAMYRLALPALTCSALVSRCCQALRAILPKDITMQVIIRWYGARNAPGSQDLSPQQEWAIFSDLLLALLGYDVDKLTRPKQNDDQVENAEVATKKQRTSSDGTLEDWDYLLNSKIHKMIGVELASILKINSPSSTASASNPRPVTDEKQAQFNTNALLFPYTVQVLYAFHLVYEENDKDSTGMEHLDTKLLRLLYPRDHRMSEVFNLLQSSTPVTINLTQRPEVSDHDFIEEQEKHLHALSTRTMALPVARGMLTLRSLPCSPTEPLSLPKLSVSGRGPPPRCNTISLPAGDSSPNQLLWPTFHNGVAAGLALVPMTGSSIDSSWIIYNKPRGTTEMSAEHAGFLMALGLNGHLRDMPFMNIYEYLIKCNEMISIGLLLGLAATYRGTMDVQATKMMSVHLEPLLPPTSIELDMQQNILVAALLGVGLVYQGTMHTHYARVLLAEIGKPPGPEMENCVEREGYALAAGLALGLVCAGGARQGLQPDHMAPRLRTYMLGGEKLPLTGSQKEKYKQASFAIREGATVNLDVTSPGATLALGLIYMRSNNVALAGWLEPPHTAYLLDFVRPDLLMLRIIARGLVLWDSIEASEEWVENQVPPSIKPYCLVKPTEENVDYEAMNQAYCNIIAGACFSLGLRFAGSGDDDARDAILHFVRRFIALGGKPIAELAGRSTLEACLCVCLLAAGMVACGRGDVAVLRLCRRLRARTTPHALHAPLTHGGQMAVHCTIGLLFLGGCRATLSTTPTAVAALLAAFFPKFPTHSEDNRYHLQAFRHLYVLAVEPRLILPRDLDTGKLCYAHIQVIDLEGAVKEMMAPCIVPELERLREVKIADPRYWPISFQRGRNWDQLRTFLEYTWCIDIKQRAGSLSYRDDPHGFLTILSQSLTLDKSHIWSPTPDNIQLFSNDIKVKNFVKHYLTKERTLTNICSDCLIIPKKRKGLKNEPFMAKECLCRQYSKEEKEHVQMLSMVTYECVVKDILCALPIWTAFLKIIKAMKTEPTSYNIWQIKLLLSHIENHSKRTIEEMKIDGQDTPYEPLISNEFTMAIKQKVSHIFDGWEPLIAPYLSTYLRKWSSFGHTRISSCDDKLKKMLSTFLVYHDLPRNLLSYKSEFSLLLGLDETNLSAEAVDKVGELLR